MVLDVDRKVGKFSQKHDTFTLQVENRFQKAQNDLKKLSKEVYKQKSNETNQSLLASPFQVKSQNKKSSNDYFLVLEQMMKDIQTQRGAEYAQIKSSFVKLVKSLEQVCLSKQSYPSKFNYKDSPNSKRRSKTNHLPMLNLTDASFNLASNQAMSNNLQQYVVSELSREDESSSANEESSIRSPTTNHSKDQNLGAFGNRDKVFDPIFYQRLTHILKELEQDAVELQAARNYFGKRKPSGVTHQESPVQYQKDSNYVDIQESSPKARQSLAELQVKEQFTFNPQVNLAGNPQRINTPQKKEKPHHLKIAVKNFESNKYLHQTQLGDTQWSVPQSKTQQVSPLNSSTRISTILDSSTLRQSNNTGQHMDYDKQWRIEEEIRRKKNSFQRRLNIEKIINQ